MIRAFFHYLGISLILAAPCLAFTPLETLVSTRGIPMPDPEFDRASFQVTWQDDEEVLWVTGVSPEDGSFDLAHALQLDTDLAPVKSETPGTGTKNGPEWEFTTGSSQILYTKVLGPTLGDCEVYRAVNDSGNWITGPFPDAGLLGFGAKGYIPIGNTRLNDPDPALCYRLVPATPDEVTMVWRKLNSPVGSIIPNVQPGGTRWASGSSHLLVHIGLAANGGTQVFLYDCNTQTNTQITFNSSEKESCWMFNAPDLGGEPVISVIENVPDQPTRIGIYRKSGASWYLYNSIRPPSKLPDIYSPEPVVFNGQSYMFCEALSEKGLPSEIWLLGIRTDAPFARLVNDPAISIERQDPEYLVIPGGLLIYFTQPDLGNIYRCAAGLGPTADHVIRGTGKVDQLQGGDGNDFLVGAGGADVLRGGDGVDQYVYFHRSDAGDVIQDFQPGTDLIHLGFLEYELGYTGKNPASDGFILFLKDGPDTQIWIDPDGPKGRKNAFPLVTVEGIAPKVLADPKNFVF